jgi:hypothetical protein
MRQAEIDQHGFAAGTEHDAARLDIVMDDMLPMQIGKRRRSLAGDAHRLFKWERQIGEPAVQRLSGDPLDHDVRLRAKSPVPKQTGICGSDNRGRIICSISKPTMAAGTSPSDMRGIFHQQRHRDVGAGDAPQRRHRRDERTPRPQSHRSPYLALPKA